MLIHITDHTWINSQFLDVISLLIKITSRNNYEKQNTLSICFLGRKRYWSTRTICLLRNIYGFWNLLAAARLLQRRSWYNPKYLFSIVLSCSTIFRNICGQIWLQKIINSIILYLSAYNSSSDLHKIVFRNCTYDVRDRTCGGNI